MWDEGPHRHDNMVHAINMAFQDIATEYDRTIFAELRPSDLRSTFVTLAGQAGVNERYLKRFIGHSPGDILGMHYEAVTATDLRREVVDTFLGAYGEKLQRAIETDCCTIAARIKELESEEEVVSAVK